MHSRRTTCQGQLAKVMHSKPILPTESSLGMHGDILCFLVTFSIQKTMSLNLPCRGPTEPTGRLKMDFLGVKGTKSS